MEKDHLISVTDQDTKVGQTSSQHNYSTRGSLKKSVTDACKSIVNCKKYRSKKVSYFQKKKKISYFQKKYLYANQETIFKMRAEVFIQNESRSIDSK